MMKKSKKSARAEMRKALPTVLKLLNDPKFVARMNLEGYRVNVPALFSLVASVAKSEGAIPAPARKLSTDQVFDIIRTERKYQDNKWPGHRHSFEEYSVYIASYLQEAQDTLSRADYKDVEKQTKDTFRKIAALAVVALEENGAEPRAGWGGYA